MDQQQKKKNNENGMAQKRKLMDDAEHSMDRKKQPKLSFVRFGLPTELVNELFAALPLKIAFGMLTKMPNGLLARNVRRIFNNMRMAMKNKYNAQEWGPVVTISEDGLLVADSSSTNLENNCVCCASLPVPKLKLTAHNPYIVNYFEVEIINRKADSSFFLGFCDKHFPLGGKHTLEHRQNSLFIFSRSADFKFLFFNFAQISSKFYNDVLCRNGDIAGIGLLYDPANESIQCFTSCNGKKLVSMNFPAKNIEMMELFPAITLNSAGDSLRANFGAHMWRYNPFKLVL